MLTVKTLRRVEVWSNWKAGGGTRMGMVPEVTAALALDNLDGTPRLTISAALTSPGVSALIRRAVIRIDQDDAPTFDEWKIVDVTDDRASGTRTVTCADFATTDLAEAPPLARTDGDGVTSLRFDSVGLTASEQITQWLLPALASVGISFVTVGTIEATGTFDLAFDWTAPLAALKLLAEKSGTEVQIRRVGITGYAVDLLKIIGGSAPVVDVRLGKNMGLDLHHGESTLNLATRLYPKGQEQGDEGGATIARAVWEISSIAGAVLGLVDPAGGEGPIEFDDQLVNIGTIASPASAYLRKPDGTLTAVTASSSTAQTVTVASSSGLVVGDVVQFRADSSGKDLTWLDNPPARALYGVKSAPLDRADIPATNNLVKNSAMRSWSGALPAGWSKVGTPTVTKQLVAPYTQIGGQSAKVEATADGQGLITAAVPVTPTALNPFISGFASIWGVSGGARVELVFTTAGGPVVRPVSPSVASLSQLGQWADLGVSGEDANKIAATAVQLRVVQNGTTASTFYVDSGQITEGASQLPFVEGSGGTHLWQEANKALSEDVVSDISYSSTLIDLEQLNPAVFSQDCTLTLGAIARLNEPTMSIASVLTRIVQYERNYLVPGQTVVTFSAKPRDLTGTIADTRRGGRRGVSPTDPTSPGDLPTIDLIAPIEQTYDENGLQRGWAIKGTVNSATGSLQIVLTGDLIGRLVSVSPLGYTYSGTEYWAKTDTDRSFVIEVDEPAGGVGAVTLTPREKHSTTGDGGVAGQSQTMNLQRGPQSILVVEKTPDIQRRKLTFTVAPADCSLHYRMRVAGHDWQPSNDDWWVINPGSDPEHHIDSTGKFVDPSVDVSLDVEVEYYAVSPSGTAEEVNHLTIDQDDLPEATMNVYESPSEVGNVEWRADDDVARVKVWGRRKDDSAANFQAPTNPVITITFSGPVPPQAEPDDAYLLFDGNVNMKRCRFKATAGAWWIIARFYDVQGRFQQRETFFLPGAHDDSAGNIFNLQWFVQQVLGYEYVLALTWEHNALAIATAHTVTVKKGSTIIASGRPVQEDYDGSNPGLGGIGGFGDDVRLTPFPSDPEAVYREIDYTVELYDSTPTLLASLTTRVKAYFLRTGDPAEDDPPDPLDPTNTPDAPILNTGDGAYSASASFGTAPSGYDTQLFYEQSLDGGSTWITAIKFVLPGEVIYNTITGLASDSEVRVKRAYKNAAGIGPWSPWSNVVTVAGSGGLAL